jgi:hypothetical protein
LCLGRRIDRWHEGVGLAAHSFADVAGKTNEIEIREYAEKEPPKYRNAIEILKGKQCCPEEPIADQPRGEAGERPESFSTGADWSGGLRARDQNSASGDLR